MERVIFLDAGGVLFDTVKKGEDRVHHILAERGFERQDVQTAIGKAKMLELPFITNWEEEERYFKRYYEVIADEMGARELAPELFYFCHYARHCEMFMEVKAVLEKLKAKHYRLAVISNAVPSMDWVFDQLGLRKYFERIILSSTVNKVKPSEAIYRYALEEMNIRPEEAVFVDDLIENIQGAERIGMKALHLQRKKQDLWELLKEEGLI